MAVTKRGKKTVTVLYYKTVSSRVWKYVRIFLTSPSTEIYTSYYIIFFPFPFFVTLKLLRQLVFVVPIKSERTPQHHFQYQVSYVYWTILYTQILS